MPKKKVIKGEREDGRASLPGDKKEIEKETTLTRQTLESGGGKHWEENRLFKLKKERIKCLGRGGQGGES